MREKAQNNGIKQTKDVDTTENECYNTNIKMKNIKHKANEAAQ